MSQTRLVHRPITTPVSLLRATVLPRSPSTSICSQNGEKQPKNTSVSDSLILSQFSLLPSRSGCSTLLTTKIGNQTIIVDIDGRGLPKLAASASADQSMACGDHPGSRKVVPSSSAPNVSRTDKHDKTSTGLAIDKFLMFKSYRDVPMLACPKVLEMSAERWVLSFLIFFRI